MKAIRPINELGNRIQEAGRIRLGVKPDGQKHPKALNTFRFTSPHEDLIDELYELYGGNVQQWDNPKSRHPHQWELISEARTIPVLVPPGGLSQWYEKWDGGGCLRRCDGETCTIPPAKSSPDDERVPHPCLCMAEQERVCEPKTRLTVVLPEITFRGTWRCDTGSWFAAEELPAIEAMLDQLQQTHVIVEANLTLEQRQQMTPQGKKKFVLPVLSIPHSFSEIAAGSAQFAIGGISGTDDPALGDRASRPALSPAPPSDDEVVEAEVIQIDPEQREREAVFTPANQAPSLQAVHARLRMVANQNELDRDKLEKAVALGVTEGAHEFVDDHLSEEQAAKALQFLSQLQSQELVVLRFNQAGRAILKRRTR